MQLFEFNQKGLPLTHKIEPGTKSDVTSEAVSDNVDSIEIPVIGEFLDSSADDGAVHFAEAVLQLTNDFRAQYGLSPLRLNRELSATAQKHSQAMAEGDFFNHVGPNGLEPWDRAAIEGYTAQTLGENIAAGHATPEQVFQGWVESEGHRQNLLNPNYTELGVGYFAMDNDHGQVNYIHYWTQVFGSGNLTFRQSMDERDNFHATDVLDNWLIKVLTLTEEGEVQINDTLSYWLDMAPEGRMNGQQWLGEGNATHDSIALIQVSAHPAITDGNLWMA